MLLTKSEHITDAVLLTNMSQLTSSSSCTAYFHVVLLVLAEPVQVHLAARLTVTHSQSLKYCSIIFVFILGRKSPVFGDRSVVWLPWQVVPVMTRRLPIDGNTASSPSAQVGRGCDHGHPALTDPVQNGVGCGDSFEWYFGVIKTSLTDQFLFSIYRVCVMPKHDYWLNFWVIVVIATAQPEAKGSCHLSWVF